MISLFIKGDEFFLKGAESWEKAFFVFRRSGIQVSNEEIESILPVYEVSLENGKGRDKEIIKKISEKGLGYGEVLIENKGQWIALSS